MGGRAETSDNVITPHGDVVYRGDGLGNRVSVFPATCRSGEHQVGQEGYRAVEHGGLVVVSCVPCAAAHPDRPARHAWVLRVSGAPTRSAELDDLPYLRMVANAPFLPD
ncbi:hypothetical protein [Actinokineospora sp. HUAS TT18]|uniref:hypothetical protein n=1 Tax=Actinokineospora sp. HUAS TT18 TaxID=3447451 RepID=UPI003F528A0B